MTRPRKFTKKSLNDAVEQYFASITRMVPVTEPRATGQYDSKGHMIYEPVAVKNSLGEEVQVLQYIVPPTIGGLAAFLGIHRDTWNAWCNSEDYPEFSDTVTRARGRIHAYLEQESLTRSGKDIKGVLFNLENNFDYKEHMKIEGSVKKLEELL